MEKLESHKVRVEFAISNWTDSNPSWSVPALCKKYGSLEMANAELARLREIDRKNRLFFVKRKIVKRLISPWEDVK